MCSLARLQMLPRIAAVLGLVRQRFDTLTWGESCVAGNASDSDGGEARADLLGIGYGSDGAGSEGVAAMKQVRHAAVRTDLLTTPACSACRPLASPGGPGRVPRLRRSRAPGPDLVGQPLVWVTCKC